MTTQAPMTWEQAVDWARRTPEQAWLVEHCYYDDPIEAAAARFLASEEWDGIRALLKPRAGDAVLEIGAGRGIVSHAFATLGCRVTALEPDPSAIVGAGAIRALCAATGRTIAIEETVGERLGFADGAFDATLAPYLLPVVPDPARTLDELARVTRRGGEIVLVNHFGAETGPVAHVEAWIGRHSAALGWRPQFSFSIVTDWIAARADVRLIERRVVRPFGLFTLVRIARD